MTDIPTDACPNQSSFSLMEEITTAFHDPNFYKILIGSIFMLPLHYKIYQLNTYLFSEDDVALEWTLGKLVGISSFFKRLFLSLFGCVNFGKCASSSPTPPNASRCSFDLDLEKGFILGYKDSDEDYSDEKCTDMLTGQSQNDDNSTSMIEVDQNAPSNTILESQEPDTVVTPGPLTTFISEWCVIFNWRFALRCVLFLVVVSTESAFMTAVLLSYAFIVCER
ncbi:hypothetical protein I9W82_003342 [Candida metapsilosis]|uniref:Uncharacterized protein n=1 Tax=Candida metapsilosis TaxID=273372 RepID=A0A8H7ZFF9_9ASCO|nr:hypothetical protein I9W82_003342 [Candida metapsilosis]